MIDGQVRSCLPSANCGLVILRQILRSQVFGVTERKRNRLSGQVGLYNRVREGHRDTSRRDYAVGYEVLSGVGVAGHLDI